MTETCICEHEEADHSTSYGKRRCDIEGCDCVRYQGITPERRKKIMAIVRRVREEVPWIKEWEKDMADEL